MGLPRKFLGMLERGLGQTFAQNRIRQNGAQGFAKFGNRARRNEKSGLVLTHDFTQAR